MAIGTLTAIRPNGTIVSVIADAATVLVSTEATYENVDNYGLVTKSKSTVVVPAKILFRGTKSVREFFSYEVGEYVCIIWNGGTLSSNDYYLIEEEARKYRNYLNAQCYVIGAFYPANAQMPAYYDEVRVIDFGSDVGKITVSLEDKSLDIDFKGEISINGKAIYLNG